MNRQLDPTDFAPNAREGETVLDSRLTEREYRGTDPATSAHARLATVAGELTKRIMAEVDSRQRVMAGDFHAHKSDWPAVGDMQSVCARLIEVARSLNVAGLPAEEV